MILIMMYKLLNYDNLWGGGGAYRMGITVYKIISIFHFSPSNFKNNYFLLEKSAGNKYFFGLS